MADAHRRFAEGRHPALPALLEQRHHLDSDVRHGEDYYGRDDRRGAPRVMGAGNSLGAAYDCPCGELLCFYNRDEITIPVDDQRIVSSGGSGSEVAEHQLPGVGGGRPENPLPPDASKTLFVEGVPADCSRTEVAHIFRIFIGYKGVRLVESNSIDHPWVDCFVDFESPYNATTAMDCIQGYIFDERDPNSSILRIRFDHSAGVSSGDGHSGRS